jgi:tRNA dimethylallyltransferase
MVKKTEAKNSVKLLVICGPTSTGKTRLALDLARKFNGEIISVDSRQVYKGMDVGTGKDLPKDSRFQFPEAKLKKEKIGCYLVGGIKIWGYDIVGPKEEFSVSHYIKFANKVIKNVALRGKLPILVGGNGLYLKGVVDGIESAKIPKNEKLRKLLKDKNIDELFEMLANLNPLKAASLNRSDKKNPRRLIRAIEIAEQKLLGTRYNSKKEKATKYDVFFIGLTAPLEKLKRTIAVRAKTRVRLGIKNEIKKLLVSGVTWNTQSMNTLGYKEWVDFFAGKKSEKEVLREWVKDEKNYAKRQMTWFKKEKRIKWFDISASGWQKNVEKIVEKWHNEVHAEES